ncbi:hypothetical protein MmiEs2_03850 [Methanimicrococcus stummii]|uniref:Uncharacterized protein n=1 Tax=Methanimicrococcus stummii TaxID=3028294 RepID=A0AA96VH92_9EURY|nr:hypothetical protein MmiEs2_03850 [Methanimicrococcus sp. Es2]
MNFMFGYYNSVNGGFVFFGFYILSTTYLAGL